MITIIIIASCSPNHLITDGSYRKSVEDKYNSRQAEYGESCPDLFEAVNDVTDIHKKEALQFLVAYMPLNDIADFDVTLLLRSVDKALEARKEMPWGEVPESLFLSFVLPPRVNNENLDSFRIVYYDEIKERVKGMTAHDAALEINHWCHEKVAYQPSDIRTSAPLATILSARGRCGEESTFTVASMRTAGIPARQVYTPRWAHTDDNHAWVEVWIDGQWYYLGACEPEPVLDRGWFTEPARRAMLVHTKAFGNYSGDELVIRRNECFAELNTLPEYAATKKIYVKVTDTADIAVKNADVRFLLYNYAELYPLATINSDDYGLCSFVTGYGDLVIWADNDEEYGFKHISVSETDTVTIVIKPQRLSGTIDFDLKAPVARTPLQGPDPESVRNNTLRLKTEDSIRNAYINTWIKPSGADSVADLCCADKKEVREILARSMGNYKSIAGFMTLSGGKIELALSILKNISAKDLRDADINVLNSHLLLAPPKHQDISEDIYIKYVVSPRIDNEKLSSWRASLNSQFSTETLAGFINDPSSVGAWIDNNIVLDEKENYYNVPITPGSVARLKRSDSHSAKILFVALCRTIGVPSRLEPGTNRPQYYHLGKWNDVWFKNEIKPSAVKGYVTFTTREKSPVPAYYTHFTLARFENGIYTTLDFEYGKKPSEMPSDIPLDPGKYMLFTGNRINDITVLAEATFFDVTPEEHRAIDVNIRDEEVAPSVIGTLPYDRSVTLTNGTQVNMKTISEKGIVALWIKPGTEPTRHIFADLPLLKEEFDNWGGYFLFFVDAGAESGSFDFSQFNNLPDNTLFAEDNELELLSSVFKDRNMKESPFPVIVYADRQAKITFMSEGYKIGIGDQIIKKIN